MSLRTAADAIASARKRVLDAIAALRSATMHVQRVRARERLDNAVPDQADAAVDFDEATAAQVQRRRKRRARPAKAATKTTSAAMKPSPATMWQRLTGEKTENGGYVQ